LTQTFCFTFGNEISHVFHFDTVLLSKFGLIKFLKFSVTDTIIFRLGKTKMDKVLGASSNASAQGTWRKAKGNLMFHD